MTKRLTISELEAQHAEMTLIAAAESTLEGFKIADRERSGCLVTQRGKVIRKRKREGAYVSEVKSTLHSTSVTQRSQVQVRPGAEVVAWNAMVKADKAIVACGGRSMLVKVVKRQPDAVTRLGDLIQRAMVAVGEPE